MLKNALGGSWHLKAVLLLFVLYEPRGLVLGPAKNLLSSDGYAHFPGLSYFSDKWKVPSSRMCEPHILGQLFARYD